MKQLLSGWGRTQFVNAKTARPEYLSDLKPLLQKENTSLLAYGCGRSYGDEALNDSGITILMTRLNRLITFDDNTGELVCESGVTLSDIQTTFLPRGFALITSPGTAYITVGGAIANDVHGKNHDRVGSFGAHCLWFDLLLASGEIIRCSRSENQAIFFATIGGLGLTGIITIACIKLQKNPGMVHVQNELISTIPALITRLREVRDSATYSVAWIDLLSKKNFGYSILSTAEPDETKKKCDFKIKHEKLRSTRSKLISVSAHFLNSVTMRCFNRLYYLHAKQTNTFFSQTLMQFLYPLDGIQHWNNLYGKKGFYQFQCVIPEDTAEAGIMAIINTVQNSQKKPYLAVMKTMGHESEGLLSFPLRGITLALDFPNQEGVLSVIEKCEAITLAHQGKIYLAKDACLDKKSFSIMYPQLSEYVAVLNQIDPEKRWQSQLANRLMIRN